MRPVLSGERNACMLGGLRRSARSSLHNDSILHLVVLPPLNQWVVGVGPLKPQAFKKCSGMPILTSKDMAERHMTTGFARKTSAHKALYSVLECNTHGVWR
jgi:hypothetical protein